MTHADTICDFLSRFGEMCDDCLSSMTKIRPRQSINSECRRPENLGRLTRDKRLCRCCSVTKIINRLTDETRRFSPPLPKTPAKPRTIEPKTDFIRDQPNQSLVGRSVQELADKIKNGELEIYNEFSLQHELGIILRNRARDRLVQFERNVSFFKFAKPGFVKREIDLVVYSEESRALDCAVELKFPRRGQYPEQMYSFCKDLVFVEQLVEAGFAQGHVVIFAEDPLFYRGNTNGIYGYFRGGKPLTGEVTKPTGKKDSSVVIKGKYTVGWVDVHKTMKYTVMETK